MQDTVARLPNDLRDALKDPLGPVVDDVGALTDGGHRPVITVGDIVTYHCLEAGFDPDIAIIDGRTERSAIDTAIRAVLPLDQHDPIPNEAGTLSAELLTALSAAVDSPEDDVLVVDGEEDLAALPAVMLAPDDAVVAYGQPGEGMVKVVVESATRDRVRSLLEQFDTTDRLWTLLA